MQKLIFIILFFYTSLNLSSQELRCRVSVMSDKIQRTDKEIFTNLQTAIHEFMNNRSWTNHVFAYNERIECAIMINLEQQLSQTEFKGTIQIQASRPVFNSSYTTVLLNSKDDDFQFTYLETEPIEFGISSHLSNLSSVLAFYAYLIIGLDYDTYSLRGGDEYFQKAETVVNNAQSAQEPGWKSFESSDRKNRYWIINSILDSKYASLRDYNYQYHRLGLDVMADNLAEGRGVVFKNIEVLQNLNRKRPDPYMHYFKMILDAKTAEFVDIFAEAPADEKARVHKILSEINPAKSDSYKRLKE